MWVSEVGAGLGQMGKDLIKRHKCYHISIILFIIGSPKLLLMDVFAL